MKRKRLGKKDEGKGGKKKRMKNKKRKKNNHNRSKNNSIQCAHPVCCCSRSFAYIVNTVLVYHRCSNKMITKVVA